MHLVMKHIFARGPYAIVIKSLDLRNRSGFDFWSHDSLCLTISMPIVEEREPYCLPQGMVTRPP